MTTEEAIDILNNTAWLGSDNGIRVYPAVKMAVTALENQSKYRWHDLRKDPMDLPPKGKTVVVAYESKGIYSGVNHREYDATYYDGNFLQI